MKIYRYLTFITGLLLFLFLFIPTAGHAESGNTYEVGTKILNVRAEPADNATIIGLLSKGNTVMAFQEKYGWVQTYYGGEEAWIAKHPLIPVSNTTTTRENISSAQVESDTITVSARSVNVRSGPDTNHSIIGSTVAGDTYELVKTSGDWHLVSLGNGSTGWIAAWLTNTDTNSEGSTPTNSNNNANNSEEQKVSTGSLSGYNIVLDPGHGGKDPGAIGLGGIYEKDIITSTAGKVAQQLRSAGATVTVTRSGDYFISLNERVRISNGSNTHAFVSLHFNAFPVLAVNGVSTYYANETSRKLAQDVHSSLATTVPLFNRGVKKGNYRVIRNTTAPSILMELGFITNPADLATVQTVDYQNKVAQSIRNGLEKYFHY